jgi:hypothetical protein
VVEPFFGGLGPRYQVQRSKIPPVVVVSLTRSNAPLRVFQGVAGVFMILPDSSLWRWGQTGLGTWAKAVGPEQVGTNCDWMKAVAANNHSVGLRTDGTLWEWGSRGNSGPAGAPRFTGDPEQVDPGHDWLDMAAGDVHSVALKKDGSLWAWGDNSMNQLGNGTGPSRPNLVQVGINKDWVAVACRQGSSTYALRKDGTLWVWGQIYAFIDGQPGAVFPRPIQVCDETNWEGLLSGGGVELWTLNGELWSPDYSPPNAEATATVTCQLVATNWAPGRSALATCDRIRLYQVRMNGTLWQTPFSHGPKGIVPSNKWRRVGKRTDWVSIWGHGTALGLTSDGTIWAWGEDPGQEYVLDMGSKIRLLKGRIMGWFGLPPTSSFTSASIPYQKEPRPLMRLVPTSPPALKP